MLRSLGRPMPAAGHSSQAAGLEHLDVLVDMMPGVHLTRILAPGSTLESTSLYRIEIVDRMIFLHEKQNY